MIAAEHEGRLVTAHGILHERCQFGARGEDLGEVAGARILETERLGLGSADVASVDDRVPDRDESLREAGVPDRRRAHVDASPALPEVERGTDDRNGSLHGAKPYRGRDVPARAALHFAPAAR